MSSYYHEAHMVGRDHRFTQTDGWADSRKLLFLGEKISQDLRHPLSPEEFLDFINNAQPL